MVICQQYASSTKILCSVISSFPSDVTTNNCFLNYYFAERVTFLARDASLEPIVALLP